MIRRLFRFLGAALLLAGLALLVRDLLALARGGGFVPEALGALWSALDAASLGWLRDMIRRHLFAALWDDGIAGLLSQPAFAVAIVLGALLLLATRPRARFRGLG